MSDVVKKSFNYESDVDKYDKKVVATKFLSRVLENAVRQGLFVDPQNDVKNSISEKKAVHLLNSENLIIPIEATLDVSYMLCCLKNFEEQGITYVVYEEPEDTSIKTILVSEKDYDQALLIVKKHEENQGIEEIYTAYGAVAAEAVSKLYQDKYDLINTTDNTIEDVVNNLRDRAGIDGHVCYIINRTNPENVAEVISIKKYKENNEFIFISEINIYKEEKRVKAYSEVEMEYGHAWQDILERIVELMDAESGVVVFNTLQEVIKYKELFYEQLELRSDLSYELFLPNMSELGVSETYDNILEKLEKELEDNVCLFVEEKDNIREQIENYRHLQVLMKEYEEEVVSYMTRNNSSKYYEEERVDGALQEELENKSNELEKYIQRATMLQIMRFCMVRNTIGKNTAEIVAETIDRNIGIIPEKFCNIDYTLDDEEEDGLWDGLDMKISRIRNNSDDEEDMGAIVS